MFHVYTHNDLDGVACGILAKCAFGEKAEVRYNSIEGLSIQVRRFLERFGETKAGEHFLIITDISVDRQNERALADYSAAGGRVKLLDHHKTALHLNQHPWAAVIVEYGDGRLASAASLFYEYLVQNDLLEPTKALDAFTELVRQYDTWEWDRNGNLQAKRLNDLFFMLSIDEFEEKMVQRLQQEPNDNFIFDEFEEKILEMEEGKIERYVRRKMREVVQTFIEGDCVGVLHAEAYHSELGNDVAKEFSHLDYIAMINMGSRRVSFRTIHDHIDVSEIAGRFGGGGHAKAAGCSLTEEIYPLYVADPFRLEPIRADAFRNRYNLKGAEKGCLYENREDEKFLLLQMDGEWRLEGGTDRAAKTFADFEDAERHLKRNHAAWLARDDAYVKFLSDYWLKHRKSPSLV